MTSEPFIEASAFARVLASHYEPDLDWDNPSEIDRLDRSVLTDSAAGIILALAHAGYGIVRANKTQLHGCTRTRSKTRHSMSLGEGTATMTSDKESSMSPGPVKNGPGSFNVDLDDA